MTEPPEPSPPSIADLPAVPSTLADGIRAWDGDVVASTRNLLHRPLVATLQRFGRRSRVAVTNGISEAMARVTAEPALDDLDLCGVAIGATMMAAGLPTWDLHAAPDWLRLPPGRRLMIVVIEVEAVPLPALGRIVPLEEPALVRGYLEGIEQLGLAPLGDVDCPGWPNVARLYRSRDDDTDAARHHLGSCAACQAWHVRRDERRNALSELAPSIGGTGLGFALAPTETLVFGRGRGRAKSAIEAASRRTGHRRSTLWH